MRLRLAGIGVGVAGVGLLGAGIGLGVASLDAQNKLSNLAVQDGTWSPAQASLYQNGQRDAAAATALYVVGGVAVATGVVLFAIGWRRDRARFAVAPAAGGGAAGSVVMQLLALRRHFGAYAVAVVALLATTGCIFAPKLGDGNIACGSDGSCPPGQSCGGDRPLPRRCVGGSGSDAAVPCVPISCSDVGRNCGTARRRLRPRARLRLLCRRPTPAAAAAPPACAAAASSRAPIKPRTAAPSPTAAARR